MKKILIKNAQLVNEGVVQQQDILIEDTLISKIGADLSHPEAYIIDAEGLHLFPGAIDDQVHFREPGLTHKEDIATGSRAAVAGGITSFMEMPNTNPQTTTHEELQKKFDIAQETAYANYSFMFGGTNDNLEEIKKIDPKTTAALKLFLGSSTGNMLVDDEKVLEQIFTHSPLLICTHCEDEETIRENLAQHIKEYGQDIPIEKHPDIRSAEACYLSSSSAIKLAKKTGARLHVFHLSTAKEMELFDNSLSLREKQITAEVCIHHLWFNDTNYGEKGTLIKWNPAVKAKADQETLFQALLDDKLDVIATDHAPHTLTEKQNSYTKAPSGGPLVQHAFQAMLEFYHQGKISLEKIVQKMAHNPAILFDIKSRGYLKEGYKADLVLIDLNKPYTVTKDNILSKCGWSPFEGTTFSSTIEKTFINGTLIYDNGIVLERGKPEQLRFDR
ncbi:dihydroorotase [Gangjinia marincola]|uniref:Dihydroorotase n=1 Tax=Gangjinia marincola TaxID=578463 RepID=A0ABP3XT81_9FLAO